MAVVVPIEQITSRLRALGWGNLIDPSKLQAALSSQSISPVSLCNYLDAANATFFDDQDIKGCTPADANKITAYLKNVGVVLT